MGMSEILKQSLLLIIAIALLIILMTWGFNAMSYGMHRLNFEMHKIESGVPYSYEELQECNGIYRNIKEYSEFYTYPSLFGNSILSKDEYFIVSKRKTTGIQAETSWEKESPSYYYCMGREEKK